MSKFNLSLLSLLVFAQLSAFGDAQMMETDALMEQVPEIINVFRWVIPYEGEKNFTAVVGDTMIFRWQGQHNVFIHPSGNCELEDAIFVGANPGTPYTFSEADGSAEGTDMFFACDIGNGAHCLAGQSLTVKVFSAPDSPLVPSNATMSPTASGTIGGTNVGTNSGTASGTTSGSDFLGDSIVSDSSAPIGAGDPLNATEVPADVTETPIVSESEAEAPVVVSNVTDAPDVEEPAPVVEEPAPVVETPPAFPPKDTTDAMDSETDSAMAGSGGVMNSVTSVVGIVGACVALALV